MKKILLKKAMVWAMALIVLTPVMAFSLPALAVDPLNPWGTDDLKTSVQDTTGLGERDPRDIAASVIRVILGFLGIVAVIIILLGGFKWMTAGGNEENVASAKKMLIAGVIGLVIILSAYALATFVIKQIIGATTGTQVIW